jgi:hypothetical protein
MCVLQALSVWYMFRLISTSSPNFLLLWNVNSKAISVTDRGGLLGCEVSRLPQFLDNQLTDDGDFVSLTRRALFVPKKIPGTNFCHN